MRIRIEGTDLPGRNCGPSPERPDACHDIHVGVQRRNNAREWLDLQRGGAESVVWTFDATATERPGGIDVLGPYIQGGPGQRFIYLSWRRHVWRSWCSGWRRPGEAPADNGIRTFVNVGPAALVGEIRCPTAANGRRCFWLGLLNRRWRWDDRFDRGRRRGSARHVRSCGGE
jgi:hypothetical protein